MTPPSIDRTAGFTLLEAVVATALMAMILTALATITRQWLPNWNRGVVRVQANEQLARGLERLSEDLAAALFIPAGAATKQPLFDGTQNAVLLVRTTFGPNAKTGLDVVRIAEVATDEGRVVLRTRLPFVPNTYQLADLAAKVTGDPVVLLRRPYRVDFAYAGPNGSWQPTWRSAAMLPSSIRINFLNIATNASVSAATSVRATLPAECVTAASPAGCLATLHDERPKSL
jgi:general secretion pathway protein J